MPIINAIKNYFELTKPRTVLLLTFTAFGTMIVAGGRSVPINIALLAIFAVALGSSGANVLTCYIDRDIDAMMIRTRLRPLPSGRIAAKKALYYGLFLVALSLIFALIINPLSSFLMLLGISINVMIYSKILKRRNPINIIIGGFSGGLPVLIGYAAVRGTILEILPFLMAGLVVLWIPTHIWSLALKYRDDYAKAKVPMLPVVVEKGVAIRCIASTTIILVIFTLALYFMGFFNLIYLIMAGALSVAMLLLNIRLFFKPSERNAWMVFKFSSPYLALIFIAMMVDRLIQL
ncbi:MAG: protoheme IX farnesyltransferase [archaeon]|nr:protoheme IX farnesyltransferase [archaeon]MCP8314869.1 protoheme IX farnesyltransferase [archaeon]MCP8317824.1 protoheme IX farnesyltransferase [archaeon]